jgi:hypothetical protein
VPALPFRTWGLVWLGAWSGALCCGCGDTCHDGSGERVFFSHMQGQTTPDRTFYQTGPIQGPYLHFPSGRIFELEHDLRAAPDEFSSLLAFDENALLDADSNNVAESAGNQVVLECADGPREDPAGAVVKGIIRVRNDTCADFYLRVTAKVNGEGLSSPEARPCR